MVLIEVGFLLLLIAHLVHFTLIPASVSVEEIPERRNSGSIVSDLETDYFKSRRSSAVFVDGAISVGKITTMNVYTTEEK